MSIAAIIPDYHPIQLDVLLPVGISFYTFQSMSYTIDVYRGKIQAENSLGIFATYVAFFPQLVAGPIERASNMLPQFRQHFSFDYGRVTNGLRLILWGLFKKVVVADTLGIYVNAVYNQVDQYTGLTLIAATIFFAFQIYCDFSGYSDIAIGTARVMGFTLMDNFRQPYLSTSLREFWRRWHISLSTWFRDYLYIPLGGNRVSLHRNLVNLMIVFVVSGLWHGASWTFVIWGALHGFYIVLESLYETSPLPKFDIPRLIRILWTFTLVCFAWIFFRANSLTDVEYVVTHLLDFSGGFQALLAPTMASQLWLIWVVILMTILLVGDWLDANWGLIDLIGKRPIVLRWTFYYVLLVFIGFALLIADADTQSFIYFQF
jgi:D-alanyl-lipoteichoic acid acyltransferase DltB (MBOAT superfamily)